MSNHKTLPLCHVATGAGNHFLSAEDVAEIVHQQGLQNCIHGMAKRIYDDFHRWPEFDKSARVAAHSKDGVIELMPVADNKLYAFKYVNGHPRNFRYKLPTVMAFGLLANVATGAPLLLSELTLTTAIRTAAVSALAAQYLARPESRIMAIIGNGAQSEFQALAFQAMLNITHVRLYDCDPEASKKLATNLADSGLHISICQSAAEAAEGVDIITTITADKANATILDAASLKPGMHINAVGGDCPGKTEFARDALTKSRVFVEFEPQTRIEGELQQMPTDFAVQELWQVFNGTAIGRSNNEEITFFDSVGFALEDYSALAYMLEASKKLGIGSTISLIPELANPKNLFGFIKSAASAPQPVAAKQTPVMALSS